MLNLTPIIVISQMQVGIFHKILFVPTHNINK